jgi:hypothetical protein
MNRTSLRSLTKKVSAHERCPLCGRGPDKDDGREQSEWDLTRLTDDQLLTLNELAEIACAEKKDRPR